MEVVATGLGDRTMVTTSWSPLFSAPAGGSWAVMTPTVASSRGTLPLTDTVMLASSARAVSYTHLRAHETKANLVCRLLLEKKKKKKSDTDIRTIFTNKKKQIKKK